MTFSDPSPREPAARASRPAAPAAVPSDAPDDAAPRSNAWQRTLGAASNPDLKLAMAASGTALSLFTVGHMVHGLRTAALDTGLTGTAQRVHRVDVAAKAVGAVVAIGNVSIPVAVQIKVVR